MSDVKLSPQGEIEYIRSIYKVGQLTGCILIIENSTPELRQQLKDCDISGVARRHREI